MLRALADVIQQAPEPDAARLDGELVTRLSEAHRESFEDAVEGLVRLARDAEAAGGALLLDAEMTDLQPAVDRLFLSALERWAADADKAFATYAAVSNQPVSLVTPSSRSCYEDNVASMAVESSRRRADTATEARRVDGVGRPKFDFHSGHDVVRVKRHGLVPIPVQLAAP